MTLLQDGWRRGAAAGTAVAILLLGVLLLLGASFSSVCLPYAVVAASLLGPLGFWHSDNPLFAPALGITLCIPLVFWGAAGLSAAVLLLAWGAACYMAGRYVGGNSRWGLVAGALLTAGFFAPFFVKGLGPKGGFWLQFSLHSGPVPSLCGILGRFGGYDAQVSALFYNRWYGTDYPTVMPQWWLMTLAYLVVAVALAAPILLDRAKVSDVS